MILGSVSTPRARCEHNCFLCSLPIAVGEVHKTWSWKSDGSVSRLRVHVACDDYAQDRIDDWTNGDGCEQNAVETDIHEALLRWAPGGWGKVAGIDEAEAQRILATWPALGLLVERVTAEIRQETG